ncbi:MAG: ribonuclease III family protein [Candidatus Bathyarchaeota archaeon]
MFSFIPKYETLTEVLLDQKLAKLGDAYVNFLYSLVLSKILADAFKKAGLRKFLPSRINRHKQADAAEALIVYAWIQGQMNMEEGLEILEKNEDNIEAFSLLLLSAKSKSKL